MATVILVSKVCFLFSLAVLGLYTIRHHWLGLHRLRLKQPPDWLDMAGFVMPRITVFVPMHNEEKVAGDVLQALVECDYDWNQLEIIAINDRSEDSTGKVIEEFAARYPIVKVFHRTEGEGGKPAALQQAAALATGEIFLLFDADYVPGRNMLKLLAAPFCDAEVGAVMGRVIPHNAGDGILPSLLCLERGAGYQVGQQARYDMGLTPQFGGTVGGVRRSALEAVGGWNTSSLTEDTDLTCRLFLSGWKVIYLNRAECYEEVARTWSVRRRQLSRWVMGHTECFHRYFPQVVRSKLLTRRQRVDLIFMLACYFTAPVLLIGWTGSLVLFFIGDTDTTSAFIAVLTVIACNVFGNQATFFELGAAGMLDGNRQRLLLLPLNLFNFFFSTLAICRALIKFYLQKLIGRKGTANKKLRWHKTPRSRAKGAGGLKRLFTGSGAGAAAPSRRSGRSRGAFFVVTAVVIALILYAQSWTVMLSMGRKTYATDWRFLVYSLLIAVVFYLHFAFAHRAWYRLQGRSANEINQHYIRLEDYFGRSFRQKVRVWLQLPVVANGLDGSRLIEKQNETIRVSPSVHYAGRSVSEHVLVVEGNLTCDPDCTFEREIYVRGDARIGADTRLQAIAVDGSLQMKGRVSIVRWADANGTVELAEGCEVRARLTSRTSIQLGCSSQIKSAFAPAVFVGAATPPLTADIEQEEPRQLPGPLHFELVSPTILENWENVPEPGGLERKKLFPMAQDCWGYDGDLLLESPIHLKSKLVVKGSFSCPSGSIFEDDVKVTGSAHIGSDSLCGGNLVTGGNLTLGRGTRFLRALRAGRQLVLSSGVQGGVAGRTVIAFADGPLHLENDVIVHGKAASGTAVIVTAPGDRQAA